MSVTSDQFWQKVKDNIEIKAKSLSSLVVAVATIAAGWWFEKTPEAQAALVAAHPFFVPYAPYIAAATWAVAAIYPQWITLSRDKAAANSAQIAALTAALEAAKAALASATAPVVAPRSLATMPKPPSQPIPSFPPVPPAAPAPAVAPEQLLSALAILLPTAAPIDIQRAMKAYVATL